MANLFLHFLNRELLRSVGHTPPKDYFEPELKILCCSTNTFLFSNFSNTIEGEYLSSAFFRDLIQAEIIKFYAEKNTLAEYWESSALRYSFDKERYPYLKEIQNGIINLEPHVVRDFSMTKKLKSRLFFLNQTKDEKYNLISTHDAKNAYWDLVKKLAYHQGEEAVTMSLVSKLSSPAKSGSKLTLDNLLGRLLSQLYLEEIIQPIQADITTGIKGLFYFDQSSRNFPIYDIYLLNLIFKVCGFDIKTHSSVEIISYRETTDHNINSKYICSILKTLKSLQSEQNSQITIRTNISKILNNNKVNILTRGRLKLTDLSSLLIRLNSKLSNSLPYFKEALNQNLNMKTILIITATDKETSALNKQSKISLNRDGSADIKGNHAVTFLGIMNDYEIWHGQCEAGSGGPSGAQAITTDLIDALSPKCVLMPGIAFGLKPKNETNPNDNQEIGDILVSTHIYTYEKARDGEQSIPRADKVPASPKPLSVLRMVKQHWSKSNMHFGILMSGEKLVDNPATVAKLLKMEPEAIGGEMEGAGIYAAAYRRNVDWIVFKSIVDWGMKKENIHQGGSSSLACEVLFDALKILTIK